MDPEIQNASSLNIYCNSKKNTLKFRKPIANNIFGCQNLKGIKIFDNVTTPLNISLKITSNIH